MLAKFDRKIQHLVAHLLDANALGVYFEIPEWLVALCAQKYAFYIIGAAARLAGGKAQFNSRQQLIVVGGKPLGFRRFCKCI